MESLTTAISVQVDRKDKELATGILSNLGLNMSTYVNMAIKQLINKDGVPFLSKEQADRCINGKDWKKIVSVSDKVKSDLEKVVKQDFISSNGAYIPEESKRHDVIKQYLNTIPSEQRNSASWTLSRMAGDYASRMETLVKKNNPGWKPGDAFDTSILDQMDDTLGGLDFKV